MNFKRFSLVLWKIFIVSMENKSVNIGFLFDLDGVLIDSESEYTKIWNSINHEYPSGYADLPLRIKGTTLTKILNEYYPEKDIQKQVEERLHQLENKMTYSYLPGAKDFLDKLKSKNIPCVLVTSSDQEKMTHLWQQLPDLKKYFEHIITGDMVATSKPSPEGYLLGASKINLDSSQCVVFEDSLQGVKAGKNAGSFVVGVCGTLSSETLAPFSNILINNFNEIDLDTLIDKLLTNLNEQQ